jgi:hypothetical protein
MKRTGRLLAPCRLLTASCLRPPRCVPQEVDEQSDEWDDEDDDQPEDLPDDSEVASANHADGDEQPDEDPHDEREGGKPLPVGVRERRHAGWEPTGGSLRSALSVPRSSDPAAFAFPAIGAVEDQAVLVSVVDEGRAPALTVSGEPETSTFLAPGNQCDFRHRRASLGERRGDELTQLRHIHSPRACVSSLVVAVTPEVPAHAAQNGERNHDRSQDDEGGRLVAARRDERRGSEPDSRPVEHERIHANSFEGGAAALDATRGLTAVAWCECPPASAPRPYCRAQPPPGCLMQAHYVAGGRALGTRPSHFLRSPSTWGPRDLGGSAPSAALSPVTSPGVASCSVVAMRDPDLVARHLGAAQTHDAAADRHEAAADRWLAAGDGERAELERRNAVIERDAAQLERDRAALLERRAR